MHTPRHSPLFLAIFGLGLVLAQSAFAASAEPVYQMQMASKGLRSPLIAPTLGPFAVPSRVVGADFQLAAPGSDSAGAFSFTSSDSSVASITGDWVSVLKAGTTVITARQAATPTHDRASTTASFTVQAPLPYGFLSSGGLTWSRPSQRLSHSEAVTYCGGTLNGTTGWRMPTIYELRALLANRVQAGYESKGWPVAMNQPYGLMRSSTPSTAGRHLGRYLAFDSGSDVFQPDDNAYYEAYVTCVK